MSSSRTIRTYRAVVVLLLLVIAGLAYKFIVAGSSEKVDDGRMAVLLAASERDLLLREMRGFIGGLQAISVGLARQDMPAVARAARDMGTSRAHDVPAAMFGKLPLEFKTLALGVHRGFEALAMDADTLALPQHSLEQLADILQRCAACHATYAVKVAP